MGDSRASASSRRTRSDTRSASATTTTTATAGRISVMDYPHPLVTLKADGTLDYSQVYDVGHRRVGQGRDHATATQDFPAGTDEAEGARGDPRRGVAQERPALHDQPGHGRAPARGPVGERHRRGRGADADDGGPPRRAVALRRAGDQARTSRWRTIEEVLVPLYLHHRYQVEAAASARRRACTTSTRCAATAASRSRSVPAREQRAALEALMATLKPSELALPRACSGSSAAAVRLRHAPRAVPALHRADVRCDHAGGRRRGSRDRLSARNPRAPRGWSSSTRSIRRCPGSTTVIDRLRDATFRKQARDAVRGRDRPRRAARGRRTPDDAGAARRHAAGRGRSRATS